MGLGIPPITIKIMLGSNPLKSIMLVRRLAVLLRFWMYAVSECMPRSILGFDHDFTNYTQTNNIGFQQTNIFTLAIDFLKQVKFIFFLFYDIIVGELIVKSPNERYGRVPNNIWS